MNILRDLFFKNSKNEINDIPCSEDNLTLSEESSDSTDYINDDNEDKIEIKVIKTSLEKPYIINDMKSEPYIVKGKKEEHIKKDILQGKSYIESYSNAPSYTFSDNVNQYKETSQNNKKYTYCFIDNPYIIV